MERQFFALTIALGIVGLVLLGVWALAHFGERAMLKPPGPRAMRRIGLFTAAFGAFQVAVGVVGSAVTGDLARSLWNVVQGVVLIASGLTVVRQYRTTD